MRYSCSQEGKGMNKELKEIYRTYTEKCREAKKQPVGKSEFVSTVRKQRKIVSYQLSLGCTMPWIISRIDDSFVLYASVKSGTVTMNVWSNMECEAITGTKVNDKK